jgi:uncharacterized membrane protein YjgN (DUF898 family)
MENLLDTSVQSNQSLQLDNSGIQNLNETRKWTMFISILGFIGMGLMILGLIVAMIVMGSFGSKYEDGMMMQTPSLTPFAMIPLIILAAIYFFPLYYLLLFSRNSATAVRNHDSVALNNALKYLRLHYRFMGILLIVVLSIYLIVILIAIAAGGMIGNMMR